MEGEIKFSTTLFRPDGDKHFEQDANQGQSSIRWKKEKEKSRKNRN